jgi:hypothetical protein
LQIHDALTGVESELPMEQGLSSNFDEPFDLKLVAFNEVYRPHGWASDLMWDVLPIKLQNKLRTVEGEYGRERVMAEWDRCQKVVAKWNGREYVPAETALKQFKDEALMAQCVPLTHRAPGFDTENCLCDYCTKERKEAAEFAARLAPENATASEDNEDYFARLAQLGGVEVNN